MSAKELANKLNISIHALREEGDMAADIRVDGMSAFLSTPSARRATPTATVLVMGYLNFYPRPPRGGRLYTFMLSHPFLIISIHALREEGDLLRPRSGRNAETFLSTPSARRATFAFCIICPWFSAFLSTPSARRATHRCRTSGKILDDFYPRPPRGGRRGGIRL